MRTQDACLDCSEDRPIQARGLCGRCYARRTRGGTLGERPFVSIRHGGVRSPQVLDNGPTYRQLDYWSRKGYLRPANPTPGSGSWREWPDSEIAIAHTMARLVAAGLTAGAAARAARNGERTELAPGVWLEVEE